MLVPIYHEFFFGRALYHETHQVLIYLYLRVVRKLFFLSDWGETETELFSLSILRGTIINTGVRFSIAKSSSVDNFLQPSITCVSGKRERES